MPIHGEYRHLVRHTKLAASVGIAEENLILAENGDVVQFTQDSAGIVDKVESGKVFVDGKGVGDVSDLVLKDRRHLSQDGIVLAIYLLMKRQARSSTAPTSSQGGWSLKRRTRI